MAHAKWQRRHYETIAAGLKAKHASSDEIEQWIRKFAADNPRFRADFFRAAVGRGVIVKWKKEGQGGRYVEREYRNRSRPRRSFKVPSLSGYRKGKRCRFGKKRVHGRWVCRRSRRK